MINPLEDTLSSIRASKIHIIRLYEQKKISEDQYIEHLNIYDKEEQKILKELQIK